MRIETKKNLKASAFKCF